jgi:hypothetical protein
MAGPDRPNSDVVEQQNKPDVSAEVSPSVVGDSTAQAGDGVRQFQIIANDTQQMVQDGVLPNTSVSPPGEGGATSPGERELPNSPPEAAVPSTDVGATTDLPSNPQAPEGQAPDRQGQIDRLRQTIDDGQKYEGIADRDAFAANIVDTANKITSLPSGSPEIQRILSDAVSDFRKANPEAANFAFSGALSDALKDRPGGGQNFISAYTNDSVIVRDRTQVSDSNPSGLVAAAFSGDTSTPEGQRQKAAFDTAQQLRQFGRPIDFNSGILGDLKFNGVLAGVPDLPPRQRPEGGPTQEQLVSQLVQNNRAPESTVRSALALAEDLAFNTSGGKLGENFSASVEALAANNPGMDKAALGRLLVGSMNAVTQSKDFGITTLGSSVDLSFINDKRLATPANKYGSAGVVLTGAFDMSTAQPDFAEAMQVSRVIQEGRARLPGNLSKENFQTFLQDTQANLGSFRFDVVR